MTKIQGLPIAHNSHDARCACEKCDSAYARSGRSRYTLADETEQLRCGHSACSQNYIDTGDESCLR